MYIAAFQKVQIMEASKTLNYIKNVLENVPTGWLRLTTHRLDIYDEKLAKTQFLEQFEILFNDNNSESSALNKLPTAYDYIRLGHPLSCLLEWVIAKLNNIKPENVISFSSKTIPVLAVLRKNLLTNKNTQIIYKGELPDFFDIEILRSIYGYKFDLKKVESIEEASVFNGSTIFILQKR
jgi:cystathionine beta-lyase/cystathionine gamma-synthase